MLTRIRTYVIIPNKSTEISVKKRFCAVLFPAKIYRPATHPIILPSVSPDKILRLYCVGGIFLFRGRLHLENFMSRPNVIPALQSTPLQNRGRNFVRGKRRFTYMSSGTLYLFLRLNNSETTFGNTFERSSGEQEPSRGHKFSILEISCPSGTSLLQCVCISEVILLGRACPKPCSWFAPDGANSNGVSCYITSPRSYRTDRRYNDQNECSTDS